MLGYNLFDVCNAESQMQCGFIVKVVKEFKISIDKKLINSFNKMIFRTVRSFASTVLPEHSKM